MGPISSNKCLLSLYRFAKLLTLTALWQSSVKCHDAQKKTAKKTKIRKYERITYLLSLFTQQRLPHVAILKAQTHVFILLHWLLKIFHKFGALLSHWRELPHFRLVFFYALSSFSSSLSLAGQTHIAATYCSPTVIQVLFELNMPDLQFIIQHYLKPE